MFTFIKYRLKCFLKNKTMIFWTLVFPVALTTMFYFVFSDMQFEVALEPFTIAVVDHGNENMKQLLLELSDKESENHLIDLQYTNEEDGRNMVSEKEVAAMIILDDVPKLESIGVDYNVTIMKTIMNTYQRVNSQITHIAKDNPQAMANLVVKDLQEGNIKLHSLSSQGSIKDMNTTYFYTALGMLCMYGAMWGCMVANDIQANQTKRAARVNIAPVSKRKLMLVDFMLAYALITIEALMLFAYMKFILDVSFGEHLLLIMAVCLLGILAMLSLGMVVGTTKLNWQSKIGIVSGGTVILNFFAGMMGSGMPYMVATAAPFMKYINPADLISRSLSMIYYYDDLTPVYISLTILAIMAVVFSFIAYVRVRRESYASI